MCGCKGKCGCDIISTTKGEKGDASPVASLGYKVYVATLTQSGTTAPVATVLQNTLGGTLVWSYNGVGDYLATLTGAFTTASKVCINKVQLADLDSVCFSFTGRVDADSISLSTYNTTTGSFVDAVLINSYIEIRVYP